MTGADPAPVRRPLQLWLSLFAAMMLAVGFAALGVNYVRESVSGHRHAGGRVGELIGAAVAIGLVYACARWAVRAEHRLREGETEAEIAAAAQARATRRQRLIRRRHRYGPISLSIALLVFGGATIAMVVGAIINTSNASRSSETQAHGIRVAGTVVSVDNMSYCSARGGCSYSATISVRLSSPVRGVSETTVSYPNRIDLSTGQPLTVLVDRHQPGYAELPGHPDATSSQWIVGFVLAVVFALLAVRDARMLRRLLAARRQLRAQAQGSGLSPPVTVRGGS